MSDFYDLTVTAADGSEVSMNDFKGKVVLIVNTATGCGFTPHYKDLEEMYEKYHDRGLETFPATSLRARLRSPMKRSMSSVS